VSFQLTPENAKTQSSAGSRKLSAWQRMTWIPGRRVRRP